MGRAPRGTRADYYLGQAGEPLERQRLLEVGGIDDGNIHKLLAEKRRQVAANPARMPAIAAAVCFRDSCVMIDDAIEDQP